MQSSIRIWDVKRVFFSLPDFWFLAILLFGWGDAVGAMFAGNWYAVNIILGICLLVLAILMVRQLFYRKVLVSFIMGLVFLIVSLYLSLALFSELAEFASLAEPKAIEMMLGGGVIVAGSLAMSVLMMIRNTLKVGKTA